MSAPSEVWVSIDRNGDPVFAFHEPADADARGVQEEGDVVHRYLHAETIALVNKALGPGTTGTVWVDQATMSVLRLAEEALRGRRGFAADADTALAHIARCRVAGEERC